MINSRALADLKPDVAHVCQQFKEQCAAAGTPVIITQTLRDAEYQDMLYAQGRTAPGKIVTKARGGTSVHEKGEAWDFVPTANGEPVWDDKSPLWEKCGAIAEGLGMEWGGRWKFIDKPHVQKRQK